ncbi:MAG: D-glycero-alpha-D-manno-heptose-1,7-bisphosphate 7-phosphatase [Flavitalea sp.]
MLDLSKIDKSWTLFLDRDGVINEEKHLSYIFHYDEFRFMPGVKEAITQLSMVFGKIIVVTNQRGIGKGLMTDDDLTVIHNRMLEEIALAGGKIDAIYYCSSMDNNHEDRKPNPGMALRAQKEIGNIDLKKSIVVGNNLSDMEFGKNAGMFTVHVRTTHPDITSPHPLIDLSCKDLPEFAGNVLK